MPRRRERVQYHKLSAFARGRMVGLREAGLSYRDIAARTGHAATAVMSVCNVTIFSEAGNGTLIIDFFFLNYVCKLIIQNEKL